MPESLTVSAIFPVKREKLYKAWLSSKEHTSFTGSKALINPKKGGKFTAWDDYIRGKNLELEPYSKIVQAWRTTEFSEKDPDSVLQLTFEDLKGKTRLTLKHTQIPDGQAERYKQGWKDFYFKSMKEYFKKSGQAKKK